MKGTSTIRLGTAALVTAAVMASPVWAQVKLPSLKAPKNGTTLAAVKTLDICEVDEETWQYSGDIAVWNEGAVDTEGLAIQDCIQNKVGSGQFADKYCQNIATNQIPAGTTLLTATTFPYSFQAAPLAGDIRNIARVTITNHSGSLGTPKGPEPKDTWRGEVPLCGDELCGCTYTQGYWKNHLDNWPSSYNPDDPFYSSAKTWNGVLQTPPGGNGYYILAHQYIAATLNKANGACVPQGIQDLLEAADAWFESNGPAACPSPSSCGTQKDWGGILDDYNNGVYEGGPAHCE